MTRTLRALLVAATAASATLLAACGGDGTTGPAPADSRAAEVVPAHAAPAHHAGHPSALPAGELPGTSLFHLASAWTDQDGAPFALPDLRGKPSVFVMFYGDCTTACPLLVKAAEDIEAALPAELRGQVEFVMVTFATEADTPAKLKAYAASKGLDREGWRWLVGSPLQTRQLATLLGVQYRALGDGMFAHSNVVTVLDREGVPATRLEGLGVALDPAVAAILSVL
ncbi:MAG TPA: SCO family protein [Trueperaceae bacterium]|nr:SCO family protein [Trueperaceae bacterium]